ncbi:septum formation initiator family protein [Gorillibacterium sp. CAU 1737]|uniref:FtsB family cell division protein n=1 Tax=Gorillibacterium sp. CAU 1737 TaxID=3140362 RepID=UPI00326186C2
MPPSPNREPKRGRKASVRRMRLALLVVLAIGIPFAYTAWGQIAKLNEKNAQLNDYRGQLDAKTKTNDAMELELKRMNDPEYREEIIRSELNQAKEGETVFDSVKPPK